MRQIVNPYADVNFESTPRVLSISHEHIFADAYNNRFKSAYDRGIRIFACVNYFPSAPSVCPAGKLGLTEDANFSSWNIPVEDWIDPSLVDIPENQFALSLEDLQQYKTTRYYSGFCPSFIDKDGNEVLTKDIPQIANMEFAFTPWVRGIPWTEEPTHHNVLGNLFSVPTNGMGTTPIFEGMTIAEERAWRRAHPLYSMAEMKQRYLNHDYQQFDGKIFGTINHTYNVEGIKKYLDSAPEVYRAMELFNQGFTKTTNNEFRNAYDSVLRQGYRIWGTAAVDWQGIREVDLMPSEKAEWIAAYNNLTSEQQAQYGSWQNYYNATAVKECPDKDRGCNVLYIDNYDSIVANNPQLAAEVGLVSYINGRYYMSGFGNYKPTQISADLNAASFSVNSQATLRAITNNSVKEIVGSSISVPITKDTTYVRFEAYFADKDFIFTNPIFYSVEDNMLLDKSIILGII